MSEVKQTKQKPRGAAALGAGPGRPKGSVNKVTKQLKEMILGALDTKGGQAYLERQAEEFPVAFMTLLGKVLPSEMRVGDPDGKPIASVAPVFNITLTDK